MQRTLKISSFLFVLLISSLSIADPNPTVLLKQCLIDRIDAISKHDTSLLAKTCTADYRLITSTGANLGLNELKKAIVASESQIKLSTIISYQPFITADESIAFAVCEIEEDVVDENQKITKSNLIVTEIYRKEKGKWKIQLTHVSQKICTSPG